MWRTISAVALVLFMGACAPQQVRVSRVQVLDLSNQPVHLVDDASNVAMLEKALSNRIRAVVKKQPEFRYRLQWLDTPTPQVWLYDGFGFLAQDGKEHEAVYRIDNAGDLNRVLHVDVKIQP